MFKHSRLPLEEVSLTQETDESSGVRHYVTPEGSRYPSITTILSAQDKGDGLQRWKERVGEKEAHKIMKQSGSLGTELHDSLEKYLYNQDPGKLMPDVRTGFKNISSWLDNHVDIVYSLEQRLCSHKLKVAGTADFIGVIDGIFTVGDFKTARSRREREWISNYFMQGCFYAMAVGESTGKMPKQISIIMSEKEENLKVFHEKTRDWIEPTVKMIREYHGQITNISC